MSNLATLRRVSFLGLEFDQIGETEAIEVIHCLAREETFRYVVTPNVDHVVRLSSEPPGSRLWASYRRASLCLCDSRVLQRLARAAGVDLAVVPGSDLTARLLEEELHRFKRVAVIGGDFPLMAALKRRYRSCEWRHHAPPMGVLGDVAAQRAILEFVQRREAELYLFAIGSPQSELLCFDLAASGATGVGLCIGASLEFLSGAKRRAPAWMQRRGLEWLFRLASEPRRLGRRYVLEGPAIFRIWWRWRTSRPRARAVSDSTRSDES